MDDYRFDALAKQLATGGISRRRLVTAMVAAVGAALPLGAAASRRCGKPSDTCTADGDCCGALVCDGGVCQPPRGGGSSHGKCGGEETKCRGTCTDLQSDPSNCGSCGNVCGSDQTCVSGVCQTAACPAGFANCDGNAANGCETNIDTDPNNCGACGNVCGSGQVCVGGVCQAVTAPTCPAGSACGDACADSTSGHCQCGTTHDGSSVCYDFWDAPGCAGGSCTVDGDCAAYGSSSTCISGFCTTPGNYCSADSDCVSGYICVNRNGGCGGCDTYTGGLGICSPVCTS